MVYLPLFQERSYYPEKMAGLTKLIIMGLFIMAYLGGGKKVIDYLFRGGEE